MILHIKTINELKSLFDNKSNILIDFFADWCGPCRMLGPVLDDLSNSLEDVQIVKVNVDQATELAQMFNVNSVPHVVFIKNGNPIESFSGFKPKDQIIKFINKNK